MKRVMAILCVMLMTASCVFCGCGKKKEENNAGTPAAESAAAEDKSPAASQYEGVWISTKAEFMGKEGDINDVVEGGFVLKFNADGTASISSEGDESTGKWSETADGVSIKGDNMNMSFKNVDGQLTFEMFGAQIYFDKQ